MSFSKEVKQLLSTEKLGYIATSGSQSSHLNIAIKAIIDYNDDNGEKIYFLDMFDGVTRKNLKENGKATVAVTDLESFCSYQFQGTATLIDSGEVFDKYTANWNMLKQNRFRERIAGNLTQSLISSLKDALHEKPLNDEYDLPVPKYVIEFDVEKIITLAPFKPKE